MKRLHVHISVPDLQKSIDFYNSLFGTEPAVSKPDYAKWMLDDPAVNFAISVGRGNAGLNHLGFQFDNDEALHQVQQRLDIADIPGMAERDADCCYANSNKYWTLDPAGIPWEQFHTMGEIKTFGDGPGEELKAAASRCGCNTTEYLHNKVSRCCA